MEITSFKISNDKASLTLSLTNATAATAISLWTDKNYKYESKKVDLTSKLTGAATETITMSLADIGIKYFDGVYFVEIYSPTKTCAGIAADLTRFKECVLKKLMEHTECVSCQKVEDPFLTNIHTMLTQLEVCIENGFVQEILSLTKSLDKHCSDSCNTCGSYKNITSNTYYAINIVTES